MSEAELILPNMRGGCVRVGNKVHTLFRLTSFASVNAARAEERSAGRAAALAALESASTVSGDVLTS